ncbi:MAG: hypothetical protein LQ351_003080 [Letrouitia transgressa]|nr:MAG: hypothetical protein LQ351_003080 [Letrouitia transgressa]
MAAPGPQPTGSIAGINCADKDALSGADQLFCLIQDPFSATFHANAFWASLGTSIGVMILITLTFSLLRPRHTIVYAPKLKYADEKHAPPRIGKGLFEWVAPVIKVKEPALVEKAGMDAAIFLRFTRMLRNMFLALGVVGVAALVPANALGTNFKWLQNQQGYLAATTPQYLGQKKGILWVHVISVWVIDLIVAFFLWRNYMAVARLRRQYFDSAEYLMSLHSRTLMITDIPVADRTDEGILRITDKVEHTAGIPRASIGRNVKELPDMIEEHEEAVRDLESILAKYLKNPDHLPIKRPTIKPSRKHGRNHGSDRVDAIDYLTERIRELEIQITHVRESVDKRNAMPFGFASYERIEEAHIVALAAKGKHPQGTTIELAPKPNDLIWKNLPLTKSSRQWRRFWNNIWVVILTIVWIAPNALIAIFLSNLSNLARVWPAFRRNFDGHSETWSAVQGIAAPALTSLIYLILPIIFRRLSQRGGDTTKSSRESHVVTKLYSFFVFNNLIVFSVFGVIYGFVAAVIQNKDQGAWKAIVKSQFFVKLFNGLCQVSYFWVVWMLQRQLGAAADLAQILNLIWTWFCRKFLSPTPRQEIEWTAPPPFEYAVYYNYFLFYATVALCFATLQPLVLPITAFYFAIDYWLKKYLLLYVLITKNESGGQGWRILFNRLVFGVILANIVMALIIRGADQQAKNPWFRVFFVIPPPILMLGVKWYCARAFDPQMTYYTKAILKDPEHLADQGKKKRKNDRVASRFGHPALYKPLTTPMVHAKARHVLSEVYRGRLHDGPGGGVVGSPPASGYSDIAMDPMSQTHPGKSARVAEPPTKQDMFEVVPESRLDFAYFQNRAEFADQLGGNGELYGVPEDLISERSSTPRSFGGGYDESNAGSRASSPAPSAMGRRVYRDDMQALSPPLGGDHSSHYRDDGSREVEGDLGQKPGSGRSFGRGRMYQHLRSDSESDLLRGAQPLGVAGTPAEEREMYGLEHWRTGGSGYAGVAGQEADDGIGGRGNTGYEPYRGR